MIESLTSLYIFGDSHARYNFKNLDIPHVMLSHDSITMHRIGRDNSIVNFHSQYNGVGNTFVLLYGEVDCRCHIYRQLAEGRELNAVCKTLVDNYFATMANNITSYDKIVVCSITPSIRRSEYERVHGVVTHSFPFMGTDDERVTYTKLMNSLISEKCREMGYIFLDVFGEYSRDDGTLKSELSDGICHISDNSFVLAKLKQLLSVEHCSRD